MASPFAKLKRSYDPNGPLYARRRLKLRGVVYECRQRIPAEALSKVRHHRLWISGLADHEPRGPFDPKRNHTASRPASPDDAPLSDARLDAEDARSGEATIEPLPDAPETQTFLVDGKPVALTAGERVDVPPPAQSFRPAHHKRRR